MERAHILRNEVKAASDCPIEGFRLKYFPYSDTDIYYELYLLDIEASGEMIALREESSKPTSPRIINSLSQFDENSIQFVHQGKLIIRKSLSRLETEILLQRIDRISIKLSPEVSGEVIMICPHIESSLHIESVNLTAFITWSNGDAESELEGLIPILQLVRSMEDSIDIDFTGLEMPMYE
jgi:hypothetical protein